MTRHRRGRGDDTALVVILCVSYGVAGALLLALLVAAVLRLW